MPTVKGDCITGENFPHQIPKRSITCADKQVEMVGHKHPCITSAASQREILLKSTEKVIPVAVIKKNILAIQTSGDDMMNRTGDIEPSVSRHAARITNRQIKVN